MEETTTASNEWDESVVLTARDSLSMLVCPACGGTELEIKSMGMVDTGLQKTPTVLFRCDTCHDTPDKPWLELRVIQQQESVVLRWMIPKVLWKVDVDAAQ